MSYDDTYANQPNDYDDIDDEYPDPGTPGGYVGDAETLLRRAIDIVATAPTMPLSSSRASTATRSSSSSRSRSTGCPTNCARRGGC